MIAVFLKKLSAISVAVMIGQATQIGSYLYLATILRPEDFGAYAVVTAVIAATSSVGAAKFELAIGLCRTKGELAGLVSLVIALAVGIAGVSGGGGALLSIWLNADTNMYLGGIGAGVGCLVIFLGTLCAILGEAFPLLSLKFGRVRDVAIFSAIRPLISAIAQLTLVLSGIFPPFVGLVVGATIGSLLSLLVFLPVSMQSLSGVRRATFQQRWRRAIGRYSYLSFTHGPQQVLSRLGLNLLPVVLATAFGPHVTGLYGLANRILCTPSQVFGKSMRGILLSEYQRIGAKDPRRCLLLHKSVTLMAVFAGAVYFMPLMIWPQEITLRIFGGQWIEVAPMLVALAAFWWTAFANIPSSTIVTIISADRLYLLYEALSFVLRVAFVTIGVVLGSWMISVVGFVAAGVVMNMLLIVFVRARVKGLV